MRAALQDRIHAGVEVYSDFSDSDPDADDMDKDSAERYRAAKKQQRRLLLNSRRGPDSDEFGPIVKASSEYGSRHSRGGSLAGKESLFDEGDGLLAKVPLGV